MDEFKKLKNRVNLFHTGMLLAGTALLFLLWNTHTALSFAAGSILGMINFRLHAGAIQTMVAAASGTADPDYQSKRAQIGAMVSFSFRWLFVAVSLALLYLYAGLHLLTGALGLLGTYAGLLFVGIMGSYKDLHDLLRGMKE